MAKKELIAAALFMLGIISIAAADTLMEKNLCPDSPNCVSSYQKDDDSHYIKEFELYGNSASQAIQTLDSLLQSLPRYKRVKKTKAYLHYESRSLIWRFVDDVEFVVDEAQGVIHVRSASRLGKYDFNVNRKRIEKIRSLWNNVNEKVRI